MNLPIDTCDDGATAFAIRVGQDTHTYPANIGRGGGTTRRRRCAWCINLVDGCAKAVLSHYPNEGWSNFLPIGSSLKIETAVMEIFER